MSIKIEELEKYYLQKIINDYTIENLSSYKIAKKFKTTAPTILKILKNNNIHVKNYSECHRIYPINEKFFDAIDSEEKVYFLGFLYADGCNHVSENRITIDIKRSDKELLEKFAKLIYLENSEDRIKNYDRKKIYKNGAEKIYYSSILNIHSKYICNLLNNYGCYQAKTFKITFPGWLDKHLIRHFIRGYFDGDGSLHLDFKKTHSCSFKITSTLNFVTKIKEIIKEELGLHMSIIKAKNSDVYDVINSGNRLIEKILDWLYKDATIYLERKYQHYLKLKQRIAEIDQLAILGTRGYSKSLINKYKKPGT